MQERMNSFVYGAFEDADLMIWVLDAKEPFGEEEQKLLELMKGVLSPVFLVINKIDLFKPEEIEAMVAEWKTRMNFKAILPIAALHKTGTEELFQALLAELHEGPAYYPHDQLTDRPERFFVSEIIREKILENYHQEIPYSCEVVVNSYKEDSDRARNLVRIECTIYVSRQSQKPIMIGQKGQAIKNLGIKSREAIERFIEKNVHLELFVKVKEDWRDNEHTLDLFGYQG
jgi:GTP-binding protein Era